MKDRRLPPDKLSEITLAVTRYLRQLEGEAWRDEPTLLGFEHVHVELVGVVPTVERQT